MSNPYVLLGIFLTLLAAFGYGTKVGADRQIASQARTNDLIAKVSVEAQEAAARAIAGIQIKYTTIQKRTEVEIRNHEIYRDCRNSPDAIGLLDAARANAPIPESAGNRRLP